MLLQHKSLGLKEFPLFLINHKGIDVIFSKPIFIILKLRVKYMAGWTRRDQIQFSFSHKDYLFKGLLLFHINPLQLTRVLYICVCFWLLAYLTRVRPKIRSLIGIQTPQSPLLQTPQFQLHHKPYTLLKSGGHIKLSIWAYGKFDPWEGKLPFRKLRMAVHRRISFILFV